MTIAIKQIPMFSQLLFIRGNFYIFNGRLGPGLRDNIADLTLHRNQILACNLVK